MATLTTVRNEILARLNNGIAPEAAVFGALRQTGGLDALRVSTAPSAKWSYCGIVPYRVVITRAGHLSAVARDSASREYRSVAKAERICTERAEDRDVVDGIRIGRVAVSQVLAWCGIEDKAVA